MHTISQVALNDPNDPSLKRQLQRFERLFGHARAAELLQQSVDVDEVLANRSIYRIFSEIMDYGDGFRGLQKMVARGNETAGHVVRLNQKEPELCFDPHLADTFCQLDGLWINCMTDRSRSDVYLGEGPGRDAACCDCEQRGARDEVASCEYGECAQGPATGWVPCDDGDDVQAALGRSHLWALRGLVAV